MTQIYKVGFTGTSRGMSPKQKDQVRAYLLAVKARYPHHTIELHHGWCIGADEQAAKIAKELGCLIIAHPGFNSRNPSNRMFRSDWNGNDEVRPEKPFIARDHDIVDETSELLATPISAEEEIRSGTWTTVRYARKRSKPVTIVV